MDFELLATIDYFRFHSFPSNEREDIFSRNNEDLEFYDSARASLALL